MTPTQKPTITREPVDPFYGDPGKPVAIVVRQISDEPTDLDYDVVVFPNDDEMTEWVNRLADMFVLGPYPAPFASVHMMRTSEPYDLDDMMINMARQAESAAGWDPNP